MTELVEHISHDKVSSLELVDFITSNVKIYRGKERQVYHIINKVIEYNTGDYGADNYGIVYVVRWRVLEDNTAYIDDLIIRKDRRKSIKLIKYIIARNWIKIPYVNEIKFDRLEKYPYRETKIYRLLKLLQGDKNGWRSETTTTNSPATTNSGAIS